jgi:hypothetical protein
MVLTTVAQRDKIGSGPYYDNHTCNKIDIQKNNQGDGSIVLFELILTLKVKE